MASDDGVWTNYESCRVALSKLNPETAAQLAIKWSNQVLLIWASAFPDDKRPESALDIARRVVSGEGYTRASIDEAVKKTGYARLIARKASFEKANEWRRSTGDWKCGPNAMPLIAAEYAAEAIEFAVESVAQAFRAYTGDRSWTYVVAAQAALAAAYASSYKDESAMLMSQWHDFIDVLVLAERK